MYGEPVWVLLSRFLDLGGTRVVNDGRVADSRRQRSNFWSLDVALG
jgi:hypothetical protein